MTPVYSNYWDYVNRYSFKAYTQSQSGTVLLIVSCQLAVLSFNVETDRLLANSLNRHHVRCWALTVTHWTSGTGAFPHRLYVLTLLAFHRLWLGLQELSSADRRHTKHGQGLATRATHCTVKLKAVVEGLY